MSKHNGNTPEFNTWAENPNGAGGKGELGVRVPGTSPEYGSDSNLSHPRLEPAPAEEIPKIDVDITSYAARPSFIDTYRRISAEIDQANAWQRGGNIEMAGFWESYLHGVGLALKFLGKVVIFIVFGLMGLKLYNWVF